jgi:hypothetical protein
MRLARNSSFVNLSSLMAFSPDRLVDIKGARKVEVGNFPHTANTGRLHELKERFAQTIGFNVVDRPIKGPGKSPRVLLWNVIYPVTVIGRFPRPICSSEWSPR